MKFLIEYTNSTEQRLLFYRPDEYSFDIEPTVHEIDFDLIINQLNLTVVDDKVVQVWGFCPYGGWIKSNYSVPKFEKGILKVQTELKPGFAYGINNGKDWPVYVNIKTGWVCIGDPEKINKAVEFINNCVAVVNNEELVSLWLKPKTLPKM